VNKLARYGLLFGLILSAGTRATLPPEEMFRVESLGSREGRHIVVLGDFSLPYATDGRSHIIDTDSGTYLGVVNTGFWHGGVLLPRSKNLIVSPETYFSRGTRGERTDIVAYYDPVTLQVLAETKIPPKRFTPVKMQGSKGLSDDDRFAFILNHTPAASVSVVDLESRSFTAEIDIPGCFNLYPTGNRSFNAICANGGFLRVEVDDNGLPASLTRTDVLFDAEEDPVTVSGVRVGDTWHHLSQGGYVHGFTSIGQDTTAVPRWSLFTDEERADDWRISGFQHLAIHAASARVYALVHQGPPETHEDPGTEVWVYDLATHERIEKIELERMALSIEVSQDNKHQLYAIAADFNVPTAIQIVLYLMDGPPALEKIMDLVLDVYDAGSGELQRSVKEIGALPSYIQVWPATLSGAGND